MSAPVRLSAERFGWLRAYIAQHYPKHPQDGPSIDVHIATELNGITFLPARYTGPDEADPMPAEPPVKPRPSPAYV